MNALIRRFTIRQRLLGSMAVLSLVIILLGGWAALALRQVQTQSDALLEHQTRIAEQRSAIQASLERVQRLEQAALLNGANPVEAAELKTRWDKEVARATEVLKAASGDADGGALLAPALAGLDAYAKALAPILQQVVDAKMDSAAGYAYAGQAAPELEKARSAADAWVKHGAETIAATHAASAEQAQRQSLLRLVAAGVVLGGFTLLMLAVVQSIVRPLAAATESAERIATGDLSEHIRAEGQDEIAHFMRGVSGMQAALRNVVGQVRSSADSIETASVEVATGNLDLSQRTEQAASNLQQTAASMEELTGQVRHSAESAQQASQLASSASEVARRGGEAMGRVVQTMEQIQTASRQIADITGVIDGIAFQTNILALNAAVEAARAGEQGRGFAVVAGEVRTLAQRSADAAKEIKRLIGASVDSVESGTTQVREAGQTMGDIVSSVGRVADIVNEISCAASEQNQGIAQIGQAVSHLDSMTQQNAALVEQSAAAAESLKVQARSLSGVVTIFNLGEPAHG